MLAGLDFYFWYKDDVVVASVRYEQHLQHHHQLLQQLQDHDLVIKLEKCLFSANQIEFQGQGLSAVGAEPMYSHTEAIQAFPPTLGPSHSFKLSWLGDFLS